jgi:hypothetical protein
MIDRIDRELADLAWSLWSELGVAGLHRQHKNCLIGLEELIILTAVVAKSDPRLRDEALDWCSKYHNFVSVSRMRTLVDSLGEQVYEPFSVFAVTLNSIAQTKWPQFEEVSPLRVNLSGKSKLLSCEPPALLSLRLRSVFGVGIRADLLAFCLTRGTNSFTAIDTVKIGYNKRSLSEVLESFVLTGLLTSSRVANRAVYCLSKQSELSVLIGSLPEIAPDWRSVIEVFITLRTSLLKTQNYSVSSKVIDSRNVLKQLEAHLKIINLSPPAVSDDLTGYWDFFCKWMLTALKEICQGNFGESFRIASVENMENLVSSLMRHVYVMQDDIDGLEMSIDCASSNREMHEKVFKENYSYVINYIADLPRSIESLFKFPVHQLFDIKLLEILHRFRSNDFPILQKEIEDFQLHKSIQDPSSALREYQDLDQILNKIRSFMFAFTEQLKKFYFYNTDVHLLTLSTSLKKRHEIIKLFSS